MQGRGPELPQQLHCLVYRSRLTQLVYWSQVVTIGIERPQRVCRCIGILPAGEAGLGIRSGRTVKEDSAISWMALIERTTYPLWSE